jgi:hypothetical protein
MGKKYTHGISCIIYTVSEVGEAVCMSFFFHLEMLT